MDRPRQRIPFKFSEDNGDGEESQILDEQEQEEVIESLRRENTSSTDHYYKFLQGCLSFEIIFHVWIFVSPRKTVTPIHVFFPNSGTPRPDLIPFATFFTSLNFLLLINVVLHLPKHLSFPRVLYSIISASMPRLPLRIREKVQPHVPLPIVWTVALLFVAPLVSLLTFRDIPQVLWWLSPIFVVGVVVLVMSWIKESENALQRLEQLRYEAKGA